MKRTVVTAVMLAAAVVMLAGCRGVPEVDGPPDRAEIVAVPGGDCELAWGLVPVEASTPTEALDTAREALGGSRVSEGEWNDAVQVLRADPDNAGADERRLYASAYLGVVQQDVRNALDAAGYPDTDRQVEVRVSLTCS